MNAIKLGAVRQSIIASTRVRNSGLNVPAGNGGKRFIVLPTATKMRSGARFGCFLALESRDVKVTVYLTTDLSAATPKVHDGKVAAPAVAAMLVKGTSVASSEGKVSSRARREDGFFLSTQRRDERRGEERRGDLPLH